MAQKKKTSKKKAQKKTSSRKPSFRDEAEPDGKKTYMHGKREEDAQEAKLGKAATDVKDCHGYAVEIAARLKNCRLATSTPEAISHDLERVLVLLGDVRLTGQSALNNLNR